VSDFGDRWDIENIESRVAHSFTKNQSSFGSNGRAYCVFITRVYKGGRNPKAWQRVGKQVVTTAIQCAGCHYVRTGIHDRHNGQLQGSLTTGGCDGANAAF